MDECLKQPPIMHLIINNLTPIDYINLYRSFAVFSRRLGTYVKPHTFLMRILEHHFKAVFRKDAATVLIERLKRGTLFLIGGILLNVLTGRCIHYQQDYDFMECGSNVISDIGPFSTTDNEYTGWTAHAVWNNTHLIQSLQASSIESVHNGVRAFDFSFVANLANYNELRILNIDSIMKERCTVDLMKYVKQKNGNYDKIHCMYTANRLRKYKYRGFEIDIVFTQNPLQSWPPSIAKVAEISKKYIVKLMERQHPESCIFTFECKCDNICTGTCLSKKICECEHCVTFNDILLSRANLDMNGKRANIWLEFWNSNLMLVNGKYSIIDKEVQINVE